MLSSPRASRTEDPSGTAAPVAVLEVRQLWGDAVLDARHFRPSAGEVRIGARLGARWDLLGVDMGWVPDGWARVLPYAPPIWSDVRTCAMDDFPASEDALGGAETHVLFRYDEDLGWLACPPGHAAAPIGADPLSIPVGDTRFEARVVTAARRAERAGWGLDHALGSSLGLMAGLGLCFGILVASAPAPAVTLLLEDDDPTFEALLRIPPPDAKPEKPKKKSAEKAKATDAGSSGPGHSRKPQRRGDRSRDDATAEALGAGVLSSDVFDDLLDSSGLNSDLVAAAGQLAAKGGYGNGPGMPGLGNRGSLRGGGGGVDGIGGVDVWGGGGPPGPGTGWTGTGKSDGILPGGDGRGVVTIGGLSKMQVDSVVKAHLNQIRYCYQRELTKDPNLGGKVSVKFTIASDGTVSGANVKASSLGNAAVDTCIANRFLSMTFPQPSGGGIVVVSYPFVFAPG